jgi:hypothetical protein
MTTNSNNSAAFGSSPSQNTANQTLNSHYSSSSHTKLNPVMVISGGAFSNTGSSIIANEVTKDRGSSQQHQNSADENIRLADQGQACLSTAIKRAERSGAQPDDIQNAIDISDNYNTGDVSYAFKEGPLSGVRDTAPGRLLLPRAVTVKPTLGGEAKSIAIREEHLVETGGIEPSETTFYGKNYGKNMKSFVSATPEQVLHAKQTIELRQPVRRGRGKGTSLPFASISGSGPTQKRQAEAAEAPARGEPGWGTEDYNNVNATETETTSLWPATYRIVSPNDLPNLRPQLTASGFLTFGFLFGLFFGGLVTYSWTKIFKHKPELCEKDFSTSGQEEKEASDLN